MLDVNYPIGHLWSLLSDPSVCVLAECCLFCSRGDSRYCIWNNGLFRKRRHESFSADDEFDTRAHKSQPRLFLGRSGFPDFEPYFVRTLVLGVLS